MFPAQQSAAGKRVPEGMEPHPVQTGAPAQVLDGARESLMLRRGACETRAT